MADSPIFQRSVVDESGNIIPNIYCEVKRESDSAMASIYSDRAATSALSNPQLFASGEVLFFVTSGVYRIRLYNGTYDKTFYWNGISLNTEQPPAVLGQLESFLVAGLPSAAASTARLVYVSNESGGAVPAFSDGTNWRRVTDRTIVS